MATLIKKEIGIGFFMGLLANLLGIIICVFLISLIKKSSFYHTFLIYYQSQNSWMLLTLGALPNLAVFFILLKINKEYRARGVVMATLLVALISYFIYFF